MKVKIIILILIAACSITCVKSQANYKTSKKTERQPMKIKTNYIFKTFKEKEYSVGIAYKRLKNNINDANYPKELLAFEKKQLIKLITAEILDESLS